MLQHYIVFHREKWMATSSSHIPPKKWDEIDFELGTQVTFLSQFDKHLEQLVGTAMSFWIVFILKEEQSRL